MAHGALTHLDAIDCSVKPRVGTPEALRKYIYHLDEIRAFLFKLVGTSESLSQ